MGKPFDEAKEAINVAKHGISLARVADFVEVAVLVDDRFDYGETRYRAWATSTASLTFSPSRFETAKCARSAFAARMQRR